MLTMTFDEYDAIENEAEETCIDDDFHYPTLAEAQTMLGRKNGLLHILQAYYNTTDAEYRRSLKEFLYCEVKLTDDEVVSDIKEYEVMGKLVLNDKTRTELLRKIEEMPFQIMGYFPTRQEIDTYVRANTIENLAFLLWLLREPVEDFTPQELDARKYVEELIKRRAEIGGK